MDPMTELVQMMATLLEFDSTHRRYHGTVECDAAHRITAFREKASRTKGFINGGVYLMDRGVLAAIEPGKNVSIETDTFPALAGAGRLQAAECLQPLLDMGTPEGIRAMQEFLGQNA